MKLIKNIQVYAPKDLGVKDVLISDYKIEKIDNHIDFPYSIETIDGTGCILTPGLIDRHVHITGGGGEAGFISRARPIEVDEILDAGITTVIGLLGTDGYTRNTDRPSNRIRMLNPDSESANKDKDIYSTVRICIKTDCGRNWAVKDII